MNWEIGINIYTLLLSHLSRVQLCATPQTEAHQAPPFLGFSRQEHWSVHIRLRQNVSIFYTVQDQDFKILLEFQYILVTGNISYIVRQSFPCRAFPFPTFYCYYKYSDNAQLCVYMFVFFQSIVYFPQGRMSFRGGLFRGGFSLWLLIHTSNLYSKRTFVISNVVNTYWVLMCHGLL